MQKSGKAYAALPPTLTTILDFVDKYRLHFSAILYIET